MKIKHEIRRQITKRNVKIQIKRWRSITVSPERRTVRPGQAGLSMSRRVDLVVVL